MAGHVLTTWLLTYAAHGALFTALAAVAERTRWGGAASRRDALWKLALVGGFLTSIAFVAAGSAPSGVAVRLSPARVIPPAAESAGASWLALGWMTITAVLALRAARAWSMGVRSAGRRRVIRAGAARASLTEILGPAADRVTLTCSRTLAVPVAFAREICVPVRALRELRHDELRALLAHEAAHVVRRDAVWLMIAAAVRTLGWWQPLNVFAASRLRLAMELCCDERAAADRDERDALARCLVKVAEWSVADLRPAPLAAMASRGSALRRRLDSLLDDAPRRDRRARPWLWVTAVALPAIWLAPVVTVASLSRVPGAAIRLGRQAPAPEAAPAPVAAESGRPAPQPKARVTARVDARTVVPSLPERVAIPEFARDEPVVVPPASLPSGAGAEAAAAPGSAPSRLRDAIAVARIALEPPPSRTRFDPPEHDMQALGWIGLLRSTHSFDPKRPKYFR